MRPTDPIEFDTITTEERKNVIIEVIEDELKGVEKLLNTQISDKEAYKLIGKKDALERLTARINSIQENSVFLVDPSSSTIGIPQYLTTDNKFLNAAYWEAMEIRDNPRGVDGSVASSKEGESGKKEAISKIMRCIKALS